MNWTAAKDPSVKLQIAWYNVPNAPHCRLPTPRLHLEPPWTLLFTTSSPSSWPAPTHWPIPLQAAKARGLRKSCGSVSPLCPRHCPQLSLTTIIHVSGSAFVQIRRTAERQEQSDRRVNARLEALIVQFDEMVAQVQEMSQMMVSMRKRAVKAAERRPAEEDR